MPFISFQSPFSLLGLLGIGLLYLAYRQVRSSTQKEVPSLFFIKQLSLPLKAKRKKKLPLRFYFEALFLLLLSIYLAQPEIGSTSKRIALIVDISQSMSALNAQGESRIDLLKREVSETIGKQSSSTRYLLFLLPAFLNSKDKSLVPSITSPLTTNEETAHISSYSLLDKEDLSREIASLTSVPFADELEETAEALGELLKAHDIDETYLYTDKETKGELLPNIPMRRRVIGSPESNAYLVSAQTRIKNDGTSEVDVTFGLAGIGSSRIEVKIEEISPNDRTLLETEFTIQGGAERQESLSLGTALGKKNTLLKVQIKSTLLRDSLSSDNELYIYHSPEETSAAGLFVTANGETHQNERISLERALQIQIQGINLDAYRLLKEDELSKYSLIVFYRTSPPLNVYTNTLILLPEEDNPLVPLLGVFSSPQITSWNTTHPITRYVKLPLLKVTQGLLFNKPSWGNSIIRSEKGALLIAGSINGHDVILSGMELLPFDGGKDRSNSILLLNILNSLSPQRNSTNNSSPEKKSALLKDFTEIEQLTPALDTFRKPQNTNLVLPPLETGIYRGNLRENNEKKLFAIQNYFPNESNTFTSGVITLDESTSAQTREPDSAFAWYLLLVGLAILLIDLILVAYYGKEVE